jgi:uncharacterized membrane protein
MNASSTRKPFVNRIAAFVLALGVVLSMGPDAHGKNQETFTLLEVPGARFTEPFGINARGDIVGYYLLVGARYGHGFLLTRGELKTIDYPGAIGSTSLSGINARGDMVGAFFDGESSHPFLLRDGVFTPIECSISPTISAEGINASGDIVGSIVNPLIGTAAGYLWRNGECAGPIVVPGSIFTDAAAINDRGDIAGTYGTPEGVHGFVLRDGQFTTIDYPHGGFTTIFGINSRGDLVGTYNGSRGYLFDASSGEFRGTEPFDTLDPRGINNRGDVVGLYLSNTPNTAGFFLPSQHVEGP